MMLSAFCNREGFLFANEAMAQVVEETVNDQTDATEETSDDKTVLSEDTKEAAKEVTPVSEEKEMEDQMVPVTLTSEIHNGVKVVVQGDSVTLANGKKVLVEELPKAELVKVISAHKDWHDDVCKLLAQKKSAKRETALMIIENQGADAYRTELEKAYSTEKARKFSGFLNSLLHLFTSPMIQSRRISICRLSCLHMQTPTKVPSHPRARHLPRSSKLMSLKHSPLKS